MALPTKMTLALMNQVSKEWAVAQIGTAMVLPTMLMIALMKLACAVFLVAQTRMVTISLIKKTTVLQLWVSQP